jgi:hypothetical protein
LTFSLIGVSEGVPSNEVDADAETAIACEMRLISLRIKFIAANSYLPRTRTALRYSQIPSHFVVHAMLVKMAQTEKWQTVRDVDAQAAEQNICSCLQAFVHGPTATVD